MTETDPGTMPAEDAVTLETESVSRETPAESSTVETTPDDSGQAEGRERDERGRFTGAERRIDELTRNWREEQRRNAELIALLQQREAPKPKEPEPVSLPTLESVGYDEAKYQAALIEYATKQAEQVVQRRLTEAEQQRAEQSRLGTFAERQREFAKATPDFEDKVMRDPTLPISAPMRDVIIDSPTGPEIAYYLANNRELAEQIARLPAHLAALEMGRIEGRIQAKKEAPKAPPVTKAPPPPPTIDATEPEVEKDPEQMTADQWAKWREKDLRKRKR